MAAPGELLQPTKAGAQEGQRPRAVQLIEADPYAEPERVRRLLAELERFRALAERLERPAPGGGSELDALWKELQEAQERDARQRSIAIARCYSMKNRHQDIMPYDRNRVVLRSGKDDYINASRVEDLSPYCPALIATQAPLLGTAADFWLMIYEQKVSVVVMLVSEQELDKVRPVPGAGPAGRGPGDGTACPVPCGARGSPGSLTARPAAEGAPVLPVGAGPARGPRPPDRGAHQPARDPHARGADADAAVPGPEPQTHRGPPPVHLLA